MTTRTYARDKLERLATRNDLMDITEKLRRVRLITDSDEVDNLLREAQEALFAAQRLLEKPEGGKNNSNK